MSTVGPARSIVRNYLTTDCAGKALWMVELECGHSQIGAQRGGWRNCVECYDAVQIASRSVPPATGNADPASKEDGRG